MHITERCTLLDGKLGFPKHDTESCIQKFPITYSSGGESHILEPYCFKCEKKFPAKMAEFYGPYFVCTLDDWRIDSINHVCDKFDG